MTCRSVTFPLPLRERVKVRGLLKNLNDGAEATVDINGGAGDVAAVIGRQKAGNRGVFFRLADPTHG